MTTSTTVRSHNTSVRDNPAYQAYLLLRVGFVVAPILFGLDKVTNLLTDWTAYLAPAIDRLVPGSATGAMLAVGVVEIAAGLVVAVRPKVGGYLVAAWLAGIITNLLLLGDHYDVALRDFGLLLAALALARLATAFQPTHDTAPPDDVAERAACRPANVAPCALDPLKDPTNPLRPPHARGVHRPGTSQVELVGTLPTIDLVRAERAVTELLAALGQDPTSEALAATPRRVAASYAELLTPAPFTLTSFPNDEGYDELVLASAIPFTSLCQHHSCPSPGWPTSATYRLERILGLSKLARVVELFARRLQVQEQLTTQIADWLQTQLEPKGVGVVLEAEHQCMTLRGVRRQPAPTP